VAPLLLENAAFPSVADAFAYCRAYARHYENFSVVSWFVPRHLRPHFYALYSFCRFTDDLGDEAAGDRLALLSAWEEGLRACYEGRYHHPIFVALGETVQAFDIPIDPFLRLIEANRLDQTAHRFPTFDDLLYYCQRSANPVGRLVLYVMGYRDAERQALSDHICTALQLANFWQDVDRDLAQGRIYIPLEDMARFGYSEEELRCRMVNDAFRRLIAFEVERARRLFEEGRRLEALVERRLACQLSLFRRGGLHVLDAIERQGFDVFRRRPTVSRLTKAGLALSALVGYARLGFFGR
jgi:squalene synthase HpnC